MLATVEEVGDPEPGPRPRPHPVDACALNHVDVDIRDGISRFDISSPHILGLELVGRSTSSARASTGCRPAIA